MAGVVQIAFRVPARQHHGLGIAVMVFSIAATLCLLAFQRHVIRRTGSMAISADALHYRTDLLVNASVIVALLLAARGWAGFDAAVEALSEC